MHPVRESKGNAVISHAYQPHKSCSRTADNLASDRERGEEPGYENIQGQKHPHAPPVDAVAFFGEEDAHSQEDQHAQYIDGKIHNQKLPFSIGIIATKKVTGPIFSQ